MSHRTHPPTQVVGHSVPKIDGLALAMGRAAFTSDELPAGCLYAELLTSPHAHARITAIDTSKAEALPGVHAVLDYRNVPRIAHTTAGQGFPEPSPYDTFIFDSKVRYVGDRVAVVAAETRETARKALSLIRVSYEPLPAVFDLEEALAPGAPVIHDETDIESYLPFDPKHNLAAWADAVVGDVEAGLAESDVVVGGEFETHYTAHAPIEPHVTLSYLDDDGRLVIRTSTQVPFHCRRIVAQALGIPVRQIRVIKPRLGGGFGGKQEILLEDLCALLTLRTSRPVLFEFSRAKEFTSSRTRHPMRMRMKLGVMRNGDVRAIDFDGVLNTGAYGSHALTVLTNVGSKCLGLVHCPNIRFHGRSAYTNLPVGGAYRGYGATQGMFALGQLLDEAAEAIGMDPLEFCLRNHIRQGETSPIFRALGEGREGVDMTIGSCGLEECIRLGAKEFDWEARRKETRRQKDGCIRRGVGMTILMQGSSIPEIDMASASVKLNDDGSVNLYTGATDLGTGANTVLSQIAAETLHIRVEDVILTAADTDNSPFDTGAYASSTTYLSGEAVRRACQRLHEAMRQVAAQALGEAPEKLQVELHRFFVPGQKQKTVSFETLARRSMYMKDQCQLVGNASAISHVSPPPFAAHFAQVEVDTQTGHVRVLDYVATVDCGVAINPQLAKGQCEGAILNAISSAITEEYLFNSSGRMTNPSFNHYKLYTCKDAPPIRTSLVETHEPTGPYGAKSVSEINTNGPLPVIANAIYDAIGVRLRTSPFSPERVMKAFEANRHL